MSSCEIVPATHAAAVELVVVGGLGFADAQPHMVAREPPLPGWAFPFCALFLLALTATDGSLTTGPLLSFTNAEELPFSALLPVCFGLDGAGRSRCGACSFGVGFDGADDIAVFRGFGGNELTCFPPEVRLTNEFKTPQNLCKIENSDQGWHTLT
jgi:hypothetical protein